jgi:hypothetical protein
VNARLYIDGFNFYYAILDGFKRREFQLGLGWCDFRKLAEQHFVSLGSNDTLDVIKYFTARVHQFASRPGSASTQFL